MPSVPHFLPPKKLDFASRRRRANSRHKARLRMPSCEGAEVLDSCWHLGGKGEACSSVCGAVELVDGTATEALASRHTHAL